MISVETELTVKKTANLCGVGMSTITYWIREKNLHAQKYGKQYKIRIEDLKQFLESSGKDIPSLLKGNDFYQPIYKTDLRCWEYWINSTHGQHCHNCVISINQLKICFIARQNDRLKCFKSCIECEYYQNIYLPRIQLVYQIGIPAAVYSDLCFWGGNSKWAELCGVQEKELVGMGAEQVIHSDSLELIISSFKQIKLDRPDLWSSRIFVKNKRYGKRLVTISILPLSQAPNVFLLLGKPEERYKTLN